jgi:hypothetical protein
MSTEESRCRCAVPTGCWGNHGWHFYRYDQQRLAADAAQRMREEGLVGSPAEAQHRQRLSDQLRTYLGVAVAYAPCPAYRAAISRQRDAQRGTAATKGQRRLEG